MWWVKRGKEGRRHTLLMCSHISDCVHFSGMVTCDYYTNKNIVLRPAITTDKRGHTPLALNLYRPTA